MYIRTKYEIVKVETVADIQTKVIFKDNFVAQSENIEELLDIIVYIYKDGGFIVTHPEEIKEKNYYEYESCYGAIRTSKGLIYVAKMNENGKLELI